MVIENLLKSLSFVSAAGVVVGNRLGYFMLYIKICLYQKGSTSVKKFASIKIKRGSRNYIYIQIFTFKRLKYCLNLKKVMMKLALRTWMKNM